MTRTFKPLLKNTHLAGHAWGHPFTKLFRVPRGVTVQLRGCQGGHLYSLNLQSARQPAQPSYAEYGLISRVAENNIVLLLQVQNA